MTSVFWCACIDLFCSSDVFQSVFESLFTSVFQSQCVGMLVDVRAAGGYRVTS